MPVAQCGACSIPQGPLFVPPICLGTYRVRLQETVAGKLLALCQKTLADP
jgi:hypothetical protein